ncbi:hypothetical protein [Pontivivens ytuae]|uniref:Uncharacterized protein n=1 Tax=Pontivivens ytuae TaxID=2789856 RepID=A0A7S9QDL1_9RHOB|nr:hypothetical protein [Pontivivens ytuae]QPH55010.1 hypothetical protein I0K15_04460 [Pontivivens ytuae]
MQTSVQGNTIRLPSVYFAERFEVIEQDPVRLVLSGERHSRLGKHIFFAAAAVSLTLVVILAIFEENDYVHQDYYFMAFLVAGVFSMVGLLIVSLMTYSVITFDVTSNLVQLRKVHSFPSRMADEYYVFSDLSGFDVYRRDALFVFPGTGTAHAAQVMAVVGWFGSRTLVFQAARQEEEIRACLEWAREAARRAQRYRYPH